MLRVLCRLRHPCSTHTHEREREGGREGERERERCCSPRAKEGEKLREWEDEGEGRSVWEEGEGRLALLRERKERM